MADRGQDYDAIVIGSGIGALTFASLMAQLRGWRVLVLERHFKPGGFTHSFARPGGFEWDAGLHYVGDMGEGMPGRRLFDLVTGGAVRWQQMPDVYDCFVYPGLKFDVPRGEENFRTALIRTFPAERANIEGYFRDLKTATRWFVRYIAAQSSRAPVNWILRALNRASARLPLTTTERYLQSRFRDPKLRALLVSQWADYGVPPGRSAFVTHAVIATHYLAGGWYPEGGAGVIAKAAEKKIAGAGGAVLLNHEVSRIAVEDGRAAGAEVSIKRGAREERAEFRAPVVVSDAGAWNTFARLLDPGVPLPFRGELDPPPEGFACVELFLGLKGDPRDLGFKGENHWIFTSYDHDAMYARRAALAEGEAAMAYLSFPSLKNPAAAKHTAEIIAPFDYAALASHRGEPWRRRSDSYEAVKDRIAGALLDLAERHYPGFKDLVSYQELATPLTFEFFTAMPLGAIYGYPATPDKYRKPWLGVATPVENLYLTGTDASVLGIVGAMMGGVATASRLLGSFGFLEIMRRARRAPR